MSTLKNRFVQYLAFLLLPCALQVALAQESYSIQESTSSSGITVIAPKANPAEAWIRATNNGCNGHAPTYFAYSVDGSSTVMRGKSATTIDTVDRTIPAGTHTIHFKSATSRGACPGVDTTFTLGTSNPPFNPTIPPYAKTSGDLSSSSRWFWMNDSATSGSSTGKSQFPVSDPALPGDQSREFDVAYSDRAGERFSLSFDRNTDVTHFVYDTYVYIEDSSQLQNLELDMNQVMADGRTVIYAFQCSGYAKAWEYSTVANNRPHWHSTGLPCDLKTWSAKTWHHVQIASHRDDNGVVTYDWVGLDGVYKPLGMGGPQALALHWAIGVLNLNFQLDGAGSNGSIKVFADKLQIYYW